MWTSADVPPPMWEKKCAPQISGSWLCHSIHFPSSESFPNSSFWATSIPEQSLPQQSTTSEPPWKSWSSYFHTPLDSSRGLPKSFLIPDSFTQYPPWEDTGQMIRLGPQCLQVDRSLPSESADHHAILLLPAYNTVIRRAKKVTKTIKQWTKEGITDLQGCLESMDWSKLFSRPNHFNEQVDVVSFFINFCEMNIISSKSVTILANNKPSFASELKEIPNKEKHTVSSLGPRRRQEINKSHQDHQGRIQKMKKSVRWTPTLINWVGLDRCGWTRRATGLIALYFISPVICFLILYFHCILMLCWFIFAESPFLQWKYCIWNRTDRRMWTRRGWWSTTNRTTVVFPVLQLRFVMRRKYISK